MDEEDEEEEVFTDAQTPKVTTGCDSGAPATAGGNANGTTSLSLGPDTERSNVMDT